MSIKTNLRNLFIAIIGALLFCGAALYNGYPILYSDSAAYIKAGFELSSLSDRPMTYGFFILLTSLNGFSLWLVVFFQNLILSYLLILLFRNFTKVQNYRLFSIIGMSCLSMLTALPYVTGNILPDVFTSIGLLAIIHIFLNGKLKKTELWFIYFLYLLSMSAHLSHIPIFILILSIILIYRKKLISDYDIKIFRKKFIITSVLSVIAFIPNSAPQAKSKHVFFMGRMAENGILISYLKETCPEKHYKICDCIDSIPDNTTDFL